MDTLLREAVPSFCSNELSSLVGKAAWPCISIYMPVADSIDRRHENVVRLRGLLKDAAARLISRRVDGAVVEMLLNPLHALTGDEPFWRQRSEGLALFSAPGVPGHCRVPAAIRAKVVVGEEFYITALLPLQSAEQEYFILVLSLEAVKLL